MPACNRSHAGLQDFANSMAMSAALTATAVAFTLPSIMGGVNLHFSLVLGFFVPFIAGLPCVAWVPCWVARL